MLSSSSSLFASLWFRRACCPSSSSFQRSAAITRARCATRAGHSLSAVATEAAAAADPEQRQQRERQQEEQRRDHFPSRYYDHVFVSPSNNTAGTTEFLSSRSYSTTATLSTIVTGPSSPSLPLLSDRGYYTNLVQKRYKNRSKMSEHLKNLDEIAHSKSRQEAEERRKKKKEKKASKKKKGRKMHEAADDEEAGAAAFESSPLDDMIEDDEHLEDEEEDEEGEDEDLLPDPKVVEKKMTKQVDLYVESLKSIRGAEPTTDMFESVMVKAYGGDNDYVPMKSVAQVVISSPTQAVITCYDPSLVKSVCDAVREKLSLNPSTEPEEDEDGHGGGGGQRGGDGTIRVDIPRMSLESRNELSKILKKRTENYRQRVRKVRRKYMDKVKQGVAGKMEHVSKDDAFRVQKDIEGVTETMMKKLNDAYENKHRTIMEI